MKKIVILILTLCLIFGFFSFNNIARGNVQPELQDNFILNGMVVSHIPASDLLSKSRNVQIGLEKVEDAYKLKQQGYFCNSNSLPLFAKVNLLFQKFTGKKPLTIFDLKDKYSKLPENDYFERETLIGTINSAVYKNGAPLSFSEKSPPEVQITYKKISTGKKSSYIPIRVVSKSKNFDTYFLMNPFSKPKNERLNGSDIAKTYDIDPCFSSIIAERKITKNNALDFTGFYVDVPSSIIDNSYFKVAEKSLKQFSTYVHKKGKLLIVENLNADTLELGKYGDIIGINYNSDVNFLERARKTFPDKLIFATINSSFTPEDTAKILQNLSLFGIYPDFSRDTEKGDFLYYEEKFNNNLDIINKYLNIIKMENGFTFSSVVQNNKFTIASFNAQNGNTLRVIQGKGDFSLKIENGSKVHDITGKIIRPTDNGSSICQVEGINTLF